MVVEPRHPSCGGGLQLRYGHPPTLVNELGLVKPDGALHHGVVMRRADTPDRTGDAEGS